MNTLLRNALKQYRRFWVSSLFLLIGSAIGVATVVITLGTSLDVALRTLSLTPNDTERTVPFTVMAGELTTDDLYQILRDLPHIAAIEVDQLFNLAPNSRSGVAVSRYIAGESWRPPLISGRYLTSADMQEGAEPVIVIGQDLAQEWFSGYPAVGEFVRLSLGGEETTVRVVGVLGVPDRLTSWDSKSVIPSALDRDRKIMSFQIKTVSPEMVAAVTAAIDQRLEAAVPGVILEPHSIAQVASDDPAQRMVFIMSMLAILVVIVSAINCGNLARFWVVRRRREIGIRQALGATRGTVIGMVLFEVLLLNAGGAALGLFLYRLGAPWLLGRITAEFRAAHILVALSSALLSGLLAGSIPALLVARLDPIDAMRTE